MKKKNIRRQAKKGNKTTSLDTSFSGVEWQNLTAAEAEVMHLLGNQFLSVRQAAIKRGTGERAVQLIRKKLIEKGFLNEANQILRQSGGVSRSSAHPWRLHAEQFKVNILYKDPEKFKSHQGRQFVNDGNTVKVWRDAIEIYSNTDFWGSTPSECDARSQSYWFRFLNRLQSDLKVILVKNRSENIERVRAEYAETRNGIAKKLHAESCKVQVFGEDGKVWLLFDNSKGLFEAETVHPKMSRPDADMVLDHFNDWRQKNPPKASELAHALAENQRQLLQIAQSVTALTQTIDAVVKMQFPQRDSEDAQPFDFKGAGYFG